MAISYDYYRIFYYVGKYGSFTSAAKILLNNQPNVTRSMNILEAELGCKLFYRSRKGVKLTPEGEKLFIHVESAFKQLQLGESEIASEKSLSSGRVSIAISEIALHGYMLPVLQKYQDAYPGIHIEILNVSTTRGIDAVNHGTVELAVVSSPTGVIRPLQETKIQPFRDILIAGKRFSHLANKVLSLSDITKYPLICLGKETKTYEFYHNLFDSYGLIFEPTVEAATTDQVIPLVRYDMGIGFVPAELAKDAISKGDIIKLNLQEEIPERHICLIWDKSRPLSVAASMLFNMIQSGT